MAILNKLWRQTRVVLASIIWLMFGLPYLICCLLEVVWDRTHNDESNDE